MEVIFMSKGYEFNKVDKKESYFNHISDEILRTVVNINNSSEKYSDDELINIVVKLLVKIDIEISQPLSSILHEIENIKYTYRLANTPKSRVDLKNVDISQIRNFNKFILNHQKNILIDQAIDCLNEWDKGNFITIQKL